MIMYKGFINKRAYWNNKLHALSRRICGDNSVLRESVNEILNERNIKSVNCSVLELTDPEAEKLYNKLLFMSLTISKPLDSAKKILNIKDFMTKNQKAAIIKICKYKFKWSTEATFSYILEMYPVYRKRLSPWEIANSKIAKLFSFLTIDQADKIIKRLDKIQKKNSDNSQNKTYSN